MATREATCHCGQLSLTVDGEPFAVSICNCLACQRRTGSAFGMQAGFKADQVAVEGPQYGAPDAVHEQRPVGVTFHGLRRERRQRRQGREGQGSAEGAPDEPTAHPSGLHAK